MRCDDVHVDMRGAARDPEWLRAFARLVGPPLVSYFGARATGFSRIPPGGALYVANHNGGMMTPDTFIFGAELIRARGVEDVPFGLAHDLTFRLPIVGHLMPRLGGVPACHEAAERFLSDGHKVLVYPGGDIESTRPSSERHLIKFGARRGYIRLALRAGVPIVPVVSVGAHGGFLLFGELVPALKALHLNRRLRLNTWPMGWSVPWGLTFGPPPVYLPFPSRILIEVLDPICFERSGDIAARDASYVDACHLRVVTSMQTAMDRILEERARLGKLAWRRTTKKSAS